MREASSVNKRDGQRFHEAYTYSFLSGMPVRPFEKGDLDMKKIGSLAAVVAAVLFLMTLAVKGDTKADNNQTVDFSNYGTWNWMPGKPDTSHQAQWMLERAVEDELSAKGLRQTDNEADFYVVAMAVVETELKSWRTDFGGLDRAIKKTYRNPNGWAVWIPEQNQAELHVGSFMIHIYDPDSQEIVWSAGCTLGLSANPKKSKKIDSAVARMLRSFPAGPQAR